MSAPHPLVEALRGVPRGEALLQILDPSAMHPGSDIVDQIVSRVSTLMEFSGLVEVEIITLDPNSELARAISDGVFDPGASS